MQTAEQLLALSPLEYAYLIALLDRVCNDSRGWTKEYFGSVGLEQLINVLLIAQGCERAK